MTDLLVTGAAGFVGTNLARYFLRKGFHVTAATHDRPLPIELAGLPTVSFDIRDEAASFEAISRARPGIVIHVAGNKNVRHCQTNPDEAFATNATGTEIVARICRRSGARIVYLSTDLVFDGFRGNYAEDEIPNPTFVYGASKRAGEIAAFRECPNALVCRSGGLFGRRSPLLGWVAAELVAGRTVETFTDVINTPTYVVALAEAIEAAIERGLSGMLHVVGSDRVSRHELFRRFADLFELDSSLLVATVAGDRRRELLLAPDVSLSTAASDPRIGCPAESLSTGLARLRSEGGL